MKTETMTLNTMRLELRGGKLYLIPLKYEGAPAPIDPAKLERWCRKVYKDEVLK